MDRASCGARRTPVRVQHWSAAASSIVSAAGKAAGLPEELSHPHALRHAAGYSLINNDVDVRLVQVCLGVHSAPATVGETELCPGWWRWPPRPSWW
jgi:integrase